jgi:methyl coenzyme M reductase beta subunit
MRRCATLFNLIVLCLATFLLLDGSFASAGLAHGVQNPRSVEAYGSLPISFIKNQGQTDGCVKYIISGPRASAFFRNDGVTFDLCEKAERVVSRQSLVVSGGTEAPIASGEGPVAGRELRVVSGKLESSHPSYQSDSSYPVEHSVLKLSFVGAAPDCVVEGTGELPGKVNYLLGNDRAKWHADIPTFKGVIYKDVWAGVDVAYHGDGRQLKYDIVAGPESDLNSIRMKYEGADKIWLDKAGDLHIKTAVTTFVERVPGIYQDKDGQRISLTGGYVLEDGDIVGFRVEGRDPSVALTIDPAADLLYSTFLGGSSGDGSNGIAVDSAGNAYVAGYTYSANFPTTTGSYQTTLNSATGGNCFVTKLGSAGTVVVYSTFLGGSGSSGDAATAIAIDAAGDAYITGWTQSTDFPTSAGAYQSTLNSATGNAFVTELNSTGSSLVYSTFLGGSYGDSGYGIAVGSGGVAYVAGWTESIDFPTTSGAYQTSLKSANGNGFVTKLNSTGTALAYSTFLGGSTADWVFAIALDSSGCAYVSGETDSRDFPTTSGAYQTALNSANGNAFVTKLSSTGSSLTYSTFLGGSTSDLGYAIALDSANDAYVAGVAYSDDFPTTTGAYQASLNSAEGNAFVTEVNSTGSSLIYSTFLGGSTSDLANAIAVDGAGDAYVTGTTCSTDFPTTGDSFQTSLKSANGNAFVTRLNSAGSSLVYSTLVGGSGGDAGNAIALYSAGTAYIAGETESTDFPTTTGVVQTSLNSAYGNAFVSKLSVNATTVIVTPTAGTNGTISPSTAQTVVVGSSLTFTATPSAGYGVNAWSVDGIVVQSGGTRYTLSNIVANHTVLVSFTSGFTVTPSVGANGTLSPNAVQTIPSGGSVTFSAVPNAGYAMGVWSLDGTAVQTGGRTYTLSNITANHTVAVTFIVFTPKVTPSAGANGTISPSTAQTVTYNTSLSFTATPSAGYIVNTWSLDGTVVQTGGTAYTLSNIIASHTVSVTFVVGYTVTPSTGANGTLTPNTPQSVASGGSVAFSAVPNAGYAMGVWSLDGTTVQTGGRTYTLSNITANHTVAVTFIVFTPKVTPSAGTNGTISPSTVQTVTYNTSLTFTATPATGYTVAGWSLDGTVVQSGGATYTLSNIIASHTVSVTFNILTYTVTPSVGSNGTLTPNTAKTVTYGSSLAFSAVPNAGYAMGVWSLDGTTVQTGGRSYTLSNITANHTVAVTFIVFTPTLTPTAGANGAISPSAVEQVTYNSSATFTATPNTGYTVNTWSVDGTVVQTGGTTYTLSNIIASHTVSVTFSFAGYVITPSVGANGTLTPNTVQVVASGGSLSFSAVPNAGYAMGVWSLDGTTVQTGGRAYTLSNITANHTVAVTFIVFTPKVTPSAGANGTISPSAAQTVTYNTSLTFTATPATGYTVAGWSLDGTVVQSGGTTYTLSNIIASHTVSVTFNILTYTVTPSVGANGTLTPTTAKTVTYGSSLAFSAVPNAGYAMGVWSLDGTTVQTGGRSYTLSNITANHTVAVTFIVFTPTLTPTAGANGAISPSTAEQVTYNSSATFTATPNLGYTVNTWSLDGTVVQTGGTTYTLSNIIASHSVSVTFSFAGYVITPSVGANGTLSPNTVQVVASGGSVAFSAVPNAGYAMGVWSLDGTTVQTGGRAYTLSNITANHTVAVTFIVFTPKVTPSAGANGTISPSAVQTVTYNTSLTFTATPATGYTVAGWSVDGTVVQSGGTTYTLSNIIASHTVSVTFNILTYTVTPSVGANGTLTPNTAKTVTYGSSLAFSAVPNAGYAMGVWSLDGATVQTGGRSYTLSNITANHTVAVTFIVFTPTLTPTAGANGAISPSTAEQVTYNSSATFTATPNLGYTVNTWSLDGTVVQTGGTTYTLSNIVASHAVSVTFSSGG